MKDKRIAQIKPAYEPVSLEDIIYNLPGHIYWKDRDGVILGCNLKQASDFGLNSPKDIIGKTDWEMPWRNIAKEIREHDRLVIESGTPQIVEEVGYISQKLPLKNSKGDIIGVLGVSIEIEDYKRAIERDRQLLEDIVAMMPGHVYWKDRDCILQGCNDQQAKDAGFKSRHEILGKTAYDLLWQNQPEEEKLKQAAIIEQNDRAIMASGEAKTMEEPAIEPNGEMKIYLSNKRPIKNEAGDVVGLVGLSFDITDKKRFEELKMQMLEKEIESLELVGNTIAHELRTPLGSISATTFLLNDIIENEIKSFDDFEANKEDMIVRLKKIKQYVDNTQTFINIILENAKDIEHVNLFPTHVSEAIEDAIRIYPYASEKHKRLISFECDKEYQIQGDAHLLKHVVLNMMKNSLFFIQKNNKGEITIKVAEDHNHVILTFEDTAEGVDPDQIPDLFTNYYSKTDVGTGIGLGFCKRVVHAFNGSISCESVKGEFMRFIMKFPKI